jgi:4-carboxymuconolactone decarboxylase
MADDEALFQKGMPIRREVLGPEYVDASMARADEFMMSFQRATTAWAWGWAWGDATLDRKTRSLMNLAMLTALNRAPEIKLHVKGALNNGVTVEEIKAALLHATAYCGIPAGLDAFRAAHEVLVSEGALKPSSGATKASRGGKTCLRTQRIRLRSNSARKLGHSYKSEGQPLRVLLADLCDTGIQEAPHLYLEPRSGVNGIDRRLKVSQCRTAFSSHTLTKTSRWRLKSRPLSGRIITMCGLQRPN